MKKIFAAILLLASSVFATTPYSGNAWFTSFATDGTKQTLINSIETALLNSGNGWTTVSGHATTNLLMASGTTPQSLQINIRFKDNAGTCVQVYLESTDGTLHSGTENGNAGASLIPTNGLTYEVVASKYQFVIYTANAGTPRQFVWAGMPYLNTALAANITRCGFLTTDNNSDSDTGNHAHLRSTPDMSGSGVNYNVMVNSSFWEIANGNANPTGSIGSPRLILNGQPANWNMTISSPTTYRWRTAAPSVVTGDVFTAWGLTGSGDEAMINGQIWDAVYIADSQPIDTTSTFDGHNWRNLTNSNTGSSGSYMRGGIWFATN